MNYKHIPLLLALPVLLTQCGQTGSIAGSSISPAEILNAQAGATAREKSLATEILSSLNAYRTSQGKTAIARSSKLGALAQTKSTSMVANNSLSAGNTSAVQKASGFTKVGQAVASFGDRGNTAAKFIDHWKSTQNDMVLSNWSKIGVGVKINSEGLAHTTLIFGGISNGTDLNQPGLLSPAGF